MPRSKTPSFVAEFPLQTTPADESALSIRLDAARNIYNASLGESLRRLDLMRESLDWQRAIRIASTSAWLNKPGRPRNRCCDERCRVRYNPRAGRALPDPTFRASEWVVRRRGLAVGPSLGML
jgi:hypothetical protein